MEMKSLARAAQNLEGQPMFKLLAKVNELERKGQRITHFEIGDPDFKSPPHAVQTAIDALIQGKTHYVNSMGISELRDAICENTQKELGFRPSREQVLIIPANAIIYFLIRCVVNPGEEIIVPDPSFPTYWAAINFVGARPVRVRLADENGFQMNPDDIRRKITGKTRLIIINSPQNPTGSVMTPEQIEEIATLAEEEDLYLLSDEVYRKISYDGAAPHSPSVRDQCKERTVILNSFSKSHAMTGWRLGYAIGPEPIIEKMDLLLQTVISCVPPFIQYGGISALDAASEQIVTGMVNELRNRRDVIVQGLNSLPGVSCQVPGGAFYVFPNVVKTGLTAEQFADFMLEKAGVSLLPGPNFGKYGEGHVRLSYTVSLEAIEESIERMRMALSTLL